MQYSVLIVSALAGLSAAATLPNTSAFPTPGKDNPITAPLKQIVPAGQPFTVQWTPTSGDKVTLYLLKGPSSDAKIISTLADSIPNSGSFVWTPDTSLSPTADATGYGLELVIEGTGQYQYSTQIGISNANPAPAAGSSSSASYGAVETAPPAGSTQGTAMGGALNETVTDGVTRTTTYCPESTGTAAPTGNGSAPVVPPTGPVTVPSSLATVAQPGATDAPGSGAGSNSAAASSAAPKSTGISTGAAVAQGVQMTGAVAVIAGLLSFFAL